MSWGEAWRLTTVLVNDPSSQVGAAIAGWDFPVTREWLLNADVYDLHVQVNTKKGRKPKPYPRPWPDKDKTRLGKATRPQSEIRAALEARGHGRSESPGDEGDHGHQDEPADDERQ